MRPGTALNAVIRDMTNKMKNGNIQIGNTKVAVQDANGNFRSMTDIVRDVSKATEGMGDAEKMAALQTTFTADSIKAMGIMCNTGADSIDGFTKELENSEGSAKKTADTMNNTLSGAITELGSAWEGFKLRLADSTGILTQLVKGLTAIVRAASKIPAPIKQIIVILALLAAAVGPVLLGIGKIIEISVKLKGSILMLKSVFGVLKTQFLILKSLILDTLIPALSSLSFSGIFGMIKTGFLTLKTLILDSLIPALSSLWAFMLANPITLVIAAIAALIAIFVVLYNKCEWFRNAVNNLWSSIKSAIQPAIDGIKKGFMQLVEGIMKAWENIKQVCEGIKEVFEGIWDMDPQKVADGFTKIFTNLSQIIPNLLQGLGNMILTILQGLIQAMFNLGVLLGQWVVNGVINLCNNVIQCIATFITNVGQFLAKLPQVVWFWLCFIVTQVGQWVVNMVQKAGEMGSQFITNVGQWLSQLPQNIWNWLISTLTTVGLWATQFIQWAIQAGSQFLSNIVNFFSNLPATIWYWLCYVISYVALWTAQMIQKGIEAGTQFVTNVINWIQQLPGRIWTWLVDTVTKVQTWASQMIAKAQQAGSQFLQRVSTYIQQLPGRIATWLSSVISRVASWASQMASKAQQAGSQFLRRVCTYIQQLPGRVWSSLSNTISKAVTFASNFASKGLQAARTFKSNIINGLAGLPGRMASIGSRIVSGIISGITGAAGRLYSTMSSIASKALNAAKEKLGIHSPSRVFRDQVGKFIPSGIAVGIQANTDSAIDSVKKLANSLVASVDMNNLSKSMKLATSGIDIDTTNNYDNNNMIGTMRQLINEVQSIKFEFDYKKMGEQMKEAVSCQNSVVYMDSDIVGKKVAKPVKEYNDFTMNRLSRFRGDKDDL